MSSQYDAASITVLEGLDPVRKRPGMYTDTSQPNHLAQEVIDNSIDEALSGHASEIRVTLHADGSIQVEDDGRGMPVDPHPELGISGVEVILTRLHAGGKFDHQQYQYSGGLHGVGVSVVNALSKRLEVRVKRQGQEYRMLFEQGEPRSALESIGAVKLRQTGTSIHFWPEPKYFDQPKFNTKLLTSLLRAKAVLCPGLKIVFADRQSGEVQEWYYLAGLEDYLTERFQGVTCIPELPFLGSMKVSAMRWNGASSGHPKRALCWLKVM